VVRLSPAAPADARVSVDPIDCPHGLCHDARVGLIIGPWLAAGVGGSAKLWCQVCPETIVEVSRV